MKEETKPTHKLEGKSEITEDYPAHTNDARIEQTIQNLKKAWVGVGESDMSFPRVDEGGEANSLKQLDKTTLRVLDYILENRDVELTTIAISEGTGLKSEDVKRAARLLEDKGVVCSAYPLNKQNTFVRSLLVREYSGALENLVLAVAGQ